MSDIPVDLFQKMSRLNQVQSLQKASPNSLPGSGKAKKTGAPVPKQGFQAYSSSRAPQQPFSELIKEASRQYGIDEKVISAVIQQESSFDPQAVSACGALGLMQLMPSTAESLGVKDPFNAQENIMAGCRYLRQKIDEFGGDLSLGLAAYNAGSGAVRKYGGIPPYKETQEYVKKITHSIDRLV